MSSGKLDNELSLYTDSGNMIARLVSSNVRTLSYFDLYMIYNDDDNHNLMMNLSGKSGFKSNILCSYLYVVFG